MSHHVILSTALRICIRTHSRAKNVTLIGFEDFLVPKREQLSICLGLRLAILHDHMSCAKSGHLLYCLCRDLLVRRLSCLLLRRASHELLLGIGVVIDGELVDCGEV